MAWNDGLVPGSAAYAIAAAPNQRVRVVAGPGTGKSFAMKRRVARLLESGVAPNQILPVTFTRVAAEDLHRELVGMGTPGCDELQGTTLHSLALRSLMRNHVLQATGRHPRPLNDFELKPLEADLRTPERGIRQVRKDIKAYEACWARLQNHEPGFAKNAADQAFENSLLSWLRFHHAMLIGEVIPIFYEYLFLNPAAPERNEYAHVLVDEYQDLNKAEQSVIELMSANSNVCIVGDDDQSIYSFKYAHPEGIQTWLNDHPQGSDLSLTECRRCPVRVVQMANALIARNVLRDGSRVLAERPENGNGDVHIIQYTYSNFEIAGVANIVEQLIQAGVAPGEILVLAQRGVIGTPIYEALAGKGIPVRSYYAEAELDAEDAQFRFALLKLYVDREDRVALRWLLGRQSTSWLSGNYRRLRAFCEASGQSPWQALENIAAGTVSVPHTTPLCQQFLAIRTRLTQLEELGSLNAVVDDLFPENVDGVRELRAMSLALLDLVPENDRTRFLAELTTSITRPEVPSEINDVRIMSLHKSKGLSAPVTIIAGCVEGLLPRQPRADMSPNEQLSSIEEQRRLFYVGVTRVKADPANQHPGALILTYSQQMPLADAMGAGIQPASVYYGDANLLPSRFIAEMQPAAPAPQAG